MNAFKKPRTQQERRMSFLLDTDEITPHQREHLIRPSRRWKLLPDTYDDISHARQPRGKGNTQPKTSTNP